jgi:hypothetical protein
MYASLASCHNGALAARVGPQPLLHGQSSQQNREVAIFERFITGDDLGG